MLLRMLHQNVCKNFPHTSALYCHNYWCNVDIHMVNLVMYNPENFVDKLKVMEIII